MYACNNKAADPLGKKTRTCLFCFEQCIIETTCPNDSQKLFQKCSKYLHSAIISEPSTYCADSNPLAGKQVVPFCEKCLKSAIELSGLIETLEFCQRNITELAFVFSLGILHRRKKCSAPVSNINNSRRRRIHHFDITALEELDNELESEPTGLGTAYPILQNNCEQILSSPEIDGVDDQEDLDIEAALPVQCELENNQLEHLNFGEIKIETGFSDGSDDVQEIIIPKSISIIGGELEKSTSGNYVKITNLKSNKSVIVSKIDIANSPLPIVKLSRLKFTEDGTVDLQQLEPVNNSVTTLNFDSNYDEAVHEIENSYNYQRSETVLPDSSDIIVNMSTMGIKIENVALASVENVALARIDNVKEGLQNRNGTKYAKEEDELYDPKYDGISNRFRCKQCRKRFNSKFMLAAHEKRHEVEKVCTICNKTFSTKQALKNHHRLHTGEKPFSCSICHKGFTVKQALKSHERLHTGEKPYQCNICEKRFTFQSGLFTHKFSHNKERPFQCLVCKRRYSLKQSLVSHLKTHNDPNFANNGRRKRRAAYEPVFNEETSKHEWKCDVCNKILSCKQSLYIHKQVHTMAHSCPICGQRFALKLGLNNHIARHTGEKRYKCQLCDYATSGPNKLRYHRITAHSKTRFRCRECGSSYKLFDVAKAHFKRVHFAIDFTDECIVTLK